jgi:N-acetylglutamate synthase-like GNAT family acetyltransferase
MTRVRPATDDDSDALQHILDEVWLERPEHEPAYFGIARNSSAWVALGDDDKAIGFAALQKRPWHPNREYLSLHVLPEFQHRGVGQTLWNTLKPIVNPGSLQTAAPESFVQTRRFLERVGFKAVMSTWTVEFDPVEVLKQFPDVAALEIRVFSEIPELRDDLARLHHDLYKQSHQFNPPLEASLDQMFRVYMAPDDLDPELLFVAFEAGQPIGLGSLRGDAEEFELGWTGAIGNRTDITHALLKTMLEQAVTRGSPCIVAELDSLDPHAMCILETIGVPRGEAWLTFQN